MSKFPKHSEFKEQLGDLNVPPPSTGWNGVVNAMSSGSGEFASVGDIEVPPPAHIWSNIAAVISPERKRRAAFWWWGGAAAAVLIGVLFTFDFSSAHIEYSAQDPIVDPLSESRTDGLDQADVRLRDKNLSLLSEDTGSAKEHQSAISKLQNILDVNGNKNGDSKSNSSKAIGSASKKNRGNVDLSIDTSVIDSGQPIKVVDHLNNWAIVLAVPKYSVIPSLSSDLYLRKDISFVIPPMPKLKPVSETILAANFGAIGKSNNISPGFSANSLSSADVAMETSIGTNVGAVYNVATEVIDFSQRVPVTFGIDLRKTFGKNWFLSSGMFYSGTTGVLKYTVNSNEEILKVKDHYVGIPLSIGLNFLDKRRFHLFSSLSHLNEALLVRTEINSFPESSKVSSFVLSPQFGVGANLGLLIKLKNNWGVSAAVSAKSYYLAPINSYWKSQRLWPAVNVSVVYNFTKKKLFL